MSVERTVAMCTDLPVEYTQRMFISVLFTMILSMRKRMSYEVMFFELRLMSLLMYMVQRG